jgi:hypothetical protein
MSRNGHDHHHTIAVSDKQYTTTCRWQEYHDVTLLHSTQKNALSHEVVLNPKK